MKVAVQLFAVARQIAGRPQIEVDLRDGATVGELRHTLGRVCPALAPLLPAMMFALEDRYVDDNQVVPAGVSLACIPPVSGG